MHTHPPSFPRRRESVRPGVFRVCRVRVPVEARSGPRSGRLLRRREASWGATECERPVRRIRTRFGRVPRRAGGFTAKPTDDLSRKGTPSREGDGKPRSQSRTVAKGAAPGVWGRNGRKAWNGNRRDPFDRDVVASLGSSGGVRAYRTGVRASVVAWKPGNSGGAKGRREGERDGSNGGKPIAASPGNG